MSCLSSIYYTNQWASVKVPTFWGPERSGSFFLHIYGTWAGMTPRLDSAPTGRLSWEWLELLPAWWLASKREGSMRWRGNCVASRTASLLPASIGQSRCEPAQIQGDGTQTTPPLNWRNQNVWPIKNHINYLASTTPWLWFNRNLTSVGVSKSVFKKWVHCKWEKKRRAVYIVKN